MSRSEQFIERHNRHQRAYFEATEKRTMLPSDSPYIRRQVDELIRFGDIKSGERVLEAGCGMGRYTFEIARRGIAVEGLDLSPVLLDRLRRFDGGRFSIPLHCADVIDHPHELDGSFDAVVGFFTLHHLHDLPKCFGAMRRFLRPGGRIVFLEPNPVNALYYIQILMTPGMKWQAEGGLMRMRPSVIARSMETAGFGRLEVARFGFFPPFLANLTWGCRLEAVLERILVWRRFLPFQLFRGVLE